MRRAETGFYDRVSRDAVVRQLLGERGEGRARVYHGWPADMTDRAAFPRITYFMASGSVRRPGVYVVRLQVDVWVWPIGANGGPGRLADLDSRLLVLLDEQHWLHDGAQLFGIALAARDFPAPPGHPFRRMREFMIDVISA